MERLLPIYFQTKMNSILSYSRFCNGNSLHPDYPLQVHIEISNLCDIKCAMCGQFSGINPDRSIELQARKRGFLYPEDINTQMEDILAGALAVQCSGFGEPTIHPEFQRIISFLSKYEVMIEFITNGMHLTKEFANFLVQKKVSKVLISFSGSTSEDYESVYIGSSFKAVTSGIRALNDAKKSIGSRYPIIEINSLGFRHHVSTFDKFVELMADLGANVVHLKKLSPYESIPHLYEHVSIYRPWVEGKIIERAMKIGIAENVAISAEQYLSDKVETIEEYEQRIKFLEITANSKLKGRKFGETPIREFTKLYLNNVNTNNEKIKDKIYRSIISGDIQEVKSQLEINSLNDGFGFYCMEPFKTLYLRHDGSVQPCCFGCETTPALGSILQETAGSIWRGFGFNVIREGVCNNEYPAYCKFCLKDKFGPRNHFGDGIIYSFLEWYSECYTPTLRTALKYSEPNLFSNTGISNEQVVCNVSHNILSKESVIDGINHNLFFGFFDCIQDLHAIGWAWFPSMPDLRVPVTVYCAQQEIASGIAFDKREDLSDMGIGDGYHGFNILLPKGKEWKKEELNIQVPGGERIPQ